LNREKDGFRLISGPSNTEIANRTDLQHEYNPTDATKSAALFLQQLIAQLFRVIKHCRGNVFYMGVETQNIKHF